MPTDPLIERLKALQLKLGELADEATALRNEAEKRTKKRQISEMPEKLRLSRRASRRSDDDV